MQDGLPPKTGKLLVINAFGIFWDMMMVILDAQEWTRKEWWPIAVQIY